MENTKIDELDAKIDKLNLNVATLATKIDVHENSMVKVMEGLDKLTTYVEKTNENNKKITATNSNGTKNCPVNIQRIEDLNTKIIETNRRIDNLDRWLIGGLITLAFQFLFIIIHFLDKIHL